MDGIVCKLPKYACKISNLSKYTGQNVECVIIFNKRVSKSKGISPRLTIEQEQESKDISEGWSSCLYYYQLSISYRWPELWLRQLCLCIREADKRACTRKQASWGLLRKAGTHEEQHAQGDGELGKTYTPWRQTAKVLGWCRVAIDGWRTWQWTRYYMDLGTEFTVCSWSE